MSRVRNFMFTMNNPTTEAKTDLVDKTYKYLCYGEEVAPTTGTPHLQGMICFKNACTLSAAIKKLPGCHVEIMRGSIDQAHKYCTKDGKFVEFGEKPMSQDEKGEAENERWQTAFEAAEKGEFDNIPADLKIRYLPNIKKISAGAYKKQKLEDTTEKHLFIFGPPRSGKSRMAREIAGEDVYIKMPNKWWDGYNGEATVIIDDLAPYHTEAIQMLKIWTDRYPFQCETKGGVVFIRPKKIIITSNYTLSQLFNPTDRGAMEARVTTIERSL